MAKLTLDQVRGKVAAIRAAAGDAEVAHGLEDALHVAVLKEVARSLPAGISLTEVGAHLSKLHKLARAALRTQRIPFPRHTS